MRLSKAQKEVIENIAKEAVRQALSLAAEVAKCKQFSGLRGIGFEVDKSSITNVINFVK